MFKPGTAARDRERFDPEDSPLTAKIRIEYERILCEKAVLTNPAITAIATTTIEIETIE